MRLLLCLLSSSALANSVILDATTKSLEVVTSSTESAHYVVSYVDNTTSAFTPGLSQGIITTATTTTILAAPAASTQRQVKWVSIRNAGAAQQNVTLQVDVSATDYRVTPVIQLLAGESMLLTAEGRVIIYLSTGLVKGETSYVCNNDAACVINPTYSTTYVQNDGGYDVAAKSAEVSVVLSGGAGVFSSTVTGQAWVTLSSRVVCEPFGTTADSLTPEAIAAAQLRVTVATLVAGVGFDVFVFSPAGLDGTVRLHCLGAP